VKKSLLIALALAALVLSLVPAAREFTFVGASTCKLCHKAKLQGRQYVIWDESLHAKAFANLSSAKAAEIGKAAGIADPPANAQCLGCHAPLAAKAPDLKSEGVTCEVCHGPGSGYKKLSVMEDREKAVQNGLVLYSGDAGAIQAHCLKCHQNPHGNPFDFGAAWEKIKHPIPGK
jgi:ABC-type amino acid transport substrate-binding protein